MRNYSNLVNKNFKVNKKRNALTILGIIFSMTLIISTGYISNYMKDINIESAKQEKGNYEVILNNVDVDDINKVINNVKVLNYGFNIIENRAEINIGDVNKTLEITALDYNSMNHIFNNNINITEGTLPVKEGEVALINLSKGELDKEIGETISFEDKHYKIVGFYEDKSTDNYNKLTGITYLDTGKLDSTVNIAFNLKDRRNKLNNIIEIANLVNKKVSNNLEGEVVLNFALLYAYGINTSGGEYYVSQETYTTFTITIIIALLTILFVYSSINISFKERVQQLSTLRCIGATSSKIKLMLLKESMLLGVYSVLPGILLGVFLSWTITTIIYSRIIGINNYGISFKMYYGIIALATILTLANIFIATLVPMLRVKNVTPLEGLRAGAISNKSIKRKNSKIIRKFFGYKGELAYKNIASNSRSFFIITTTLISLLVVITCFSSYYIYLTKDFKSEYAKAFDISADINGQYTGDYKDLQKVMDKVELVEEKILKSNSISKVSSYVSTKINVTLDGVNINQKLNNSDYLLNEIIFQDEDIITSPAQLLIYDDESLKEMLPFINTSSSKETNFNFEKFKHNGFIVVDSGYSLSKPPILAKSKEVAMYLDNNAPINAKYLGSIYHKDLIGAERYGYYNYLTIIVSRDFYFNNKELLNKNNNGLNAINLSVNYNKDNKDSARNVKEIISEYGGYYIETKKDLEEFQKNIDAMAVVIYTVIFLTMLIGGINVINTRTINITLRKKEFGTLISIGMKNDDIKKLIILEGIIQWVISSVLGVIISVVLVKLINLMMLFTNASEMYPIPLAVISLGVFINLVINVLSSIMPYMKLKDLNLSELLRNDE